MKRITLVLDAENYQKIKEHKLFCGIADLCTVEEVYYDQFRVDKDEGKDGSRYIIMNNSEDVVYAFYSAAACRQFAEELQIDLEKVLFHAVRKELGFERKY